VTEAITCWKYRRGSGNILYNPTPLWVSIPWAAFFLTIICTWVYLRFKPGRTKKYPQISPTKKKEKNTEGQG